MPAEIRDVIYQLLFLNHWRGKTHPLIIALRPNQVLYQHAIGVYENLNPFILGPRNDWLSHKSLFYKAVPLTPLQYIKHLVVDMPLILRASS